MVLTRCKDQSRSTLEEFYGDLRDSPQAKGNQAMLNLIARLRSLSDDRRVWGLTSMGRLCLLAKDTYQSPWFVIIGVLDQSNYFIEYLMAAHSAPWPNAYVKGEARCEDEAVQI